jgi:hypothetical protein
MLIPRYSLRWLLGLTTFSALISLVLSFAVKGQAWAIGVASGLWTAVIAALFYVAAFLAAWFLAQFVTATRRSSPGGGESPFGSRPPQPAADSPPAMTG